jgi:hypothetical protein
MHRKPNAVDPSSASSSPRLTRRRAALLALAVPLAMWACSKAGVPLKELTVDQAQAKIASNDGKTFVYDCNDADMFKDGHLPGAKWVENSTVPANQLPPDKSATLIFYCANEH